MNMLKMFVGFVFVVGATVLVEGQSRRCFIDFDCSGNERCHRRLCVPRGGNACTYDEDCSINERCELRRCVMRNTSPMCETNNDCSINEQCRFGRCVIGTQGCQNDFECPNGWCIGGTTCVGGDTCRTNDQCSFIERCEFGRCVIDGQNCRSVSDCPFNNACRRGKCIGDVVMIPECRRDSECLRGRCQRGRCTGGECTFDLQCSRNQRCRLGQCVPNDINPPRCRSDLQCSPNQRCRLGQCVPNDINPPRCRRDYECPNGRCLQETCIVNPTPTACNRYLGLHCNRGYRCVNRQCIPNDESDCGQQRPCQLGYNCRMGLCVRDVTLQPRTCQYSSQCPLLQRCVSGRCVQTAG
nr:uncharacterized protein DDB_G0272530-like isoform X1 [Crassostrea gigas]